MLGYRRGVRKLESRAAEPEKSANFGCLVNAGRLAEDVDRGLDVWPVLEELVEAWRENQ